MEQEIGQRQQHHGFANGDDARNGANVVAAFDFDGRRLEIGGNRLLGNCYRRDRRVRRPHHDVHAAGQPPETFTEIATAAGRLLSIGARGVVTVSLRVGGVGRAGGVFVATEAHDAASQRQAATALAEHYEALAHHYDRGDAGGSAASTTLGSENTTTTEEPSLMGDATCKAPDPANRTIGIVDEALRRVSRQRADLGAYQNRFEMAAKGVAVASENMQAAESLIRDADIAAQMVEYTKDSILLQSSTAMLAQANLKPRSVLQLLA